MQFTFTAPLWIYAGKGAWHFVTLPREAADEIKFFNPSAKGLTPIKVSARIGETTWKTAIFPDPRSGSYIVAIKAEVRITQKLTVGDSVDMSISIL